MQDIQKKTLNPTWKEDKWLLVQEPKTQFMRVQMFDHDMLNLKVGRTTPSLLVPSHHTYAADIRSLEICLALMCERSIALLYAQAVAGKCNVALSCRRGYAQDLPDLPCNVRNI